MSDLKKKGMCMVILRFTKFMTARFVLNDSDLEDSPLQKLHPEVKIVSS